MRLNPILGSALAVCLGACGATPVDGPDAGNPVPDAGEVVTPDAGETPDAGGPERLGFSGSVRDAEGHAASARIYIEGSRAFAETDGEGVFHFPRLAPGIYRLLAETPAGDSLLTQVSYDGVALGVGRGGLLQQGREVGHAAKPRPGPRGLSAPDPHVRGRQR